MTKKMRTGQNRTGKIWKHRGIWHLNLGASTKTFGSYQGALDYRKEQAQNGV